MSDNLPSAGELVALNDMADIVAAETPPVRFRLVEPEAPSPDRRTYIGGSDAPGIMGASEWSNPLRVYAKKVAETQDDHDSEVMFWGRELEPIVARVYAKRTGRVLEPCGFMRHPIHAWMGGHVDSLVVDEKLGRGVLEIKTTGAHHAGRWEDEPPLEPLIQLHHYLAVAGLAWGSVAVLIGGQRFKWYDVKANQGFIATLIEKEAAFWGRVQRREPPEPDGTDASRDAIAAIYPRENGASVILGEEAHRITDELVTLKAERDRLDFAIKEHENRLRMEIGDATFGLLQDGRRWTYRTVSKAEHVVKASSYRQLWAPK